MYRDSYPLETPYASGEPASSVTEVLFKALEVEVSSLKMRGYGPKQRYVHSLDVNLASR